jgi:hypothetical protein
MPLEWSICCRTGSPQPVAQQTAATSQLRASSFRPPSRAPSLNFQSPSTLFAHQSSNPNFPTNINQNRPPTSTQLSLARLAPPASPRVPSLYTTNYSHSVCLLLLRFDLPCRAVLCLFAASPICGAPPSPLSSWAPPPTARGFW